RNPVQHCQGDEVRLLGLGYFVAASTHYSASVCVPTQERGNEKIEEDFNDYASDNKLS
ncbi:MAG: hypothetical protein RI893_199, partial [Pseudomonadota bacterium]